MGEPKTTQDRCVKQNLQYNLRTLLKRKIINVAQVYLKHHIVEGRVWIIVIPLAKVIERKGNASIDLEKLTQKVRTFNLYVRVKTLPSCFKDRRLHMVEDLCESVYDG